MSEKEEALNKSICLSELLFLKNKKVFSVTQAQKLHLIKILFEIIFKEITAVKSKETWRI